MQEKIRLPESKAELVGGGTKMTPKPRILKKVEELSDQIANFMEQPNPDEPRPNPDPTLVDKDNVLFWPDFLVDPEPARCICYHGGKALHCKENKTQIEDYADHFKDLPEKLFPNCIVRKYADVYKAGMKLLEDNQ